MAFEFSTIGVKLKYAVEATAGTRPTSSYTQIPDLKEIPEIGRTPSQLRVTNLEDTDHRYIPGVRDSGGDIQFTGNLTTALKEAWASLVSAADAAWNSNKATWFEVAIPNFDSFYFAGRPTELFLGSMGVDAVAETQLHIIPNEIVGFAAAST